MWNLCKGEGIMSTAFFKRELWVGFNFNTCRCLTLQWAKRTRSRSSNIVVSYFWIFFKIARPIGFKFIVQIVESATYGAFLSDRVPLNCSNCATSPPTSTLLLEMISTISISEVELAACQSIFERFQTVAPDKPSWPSGSLFTEGVGLVCNPANQRSRVQIPSSATLFESMPCS